ncbi:alpha/beta hydrolase [Maritalea mobilis]|uniref:alpha/beta fold hydrolase n=1 Tax=Maritalea mobilis TaxID=483324 RepID=UPI001C98BA70|nr:alpha/beta hydrolase [Maritalea mobilis]MBY6201453.1 alpha/beta hydrolase [Maritalea mobilis]
MAPKVDFIETGRGPIVVLIHSSVAGAGQWRRLVEELSDDFHVFAVNLYGYSGTDRWPDAQVQGLADQADLLAGFLPDPENHFSIVGHSFGGSVAMKAAELYRDRVDKLVLIEPNPFYLLSQEGRTEAFAEALALRNCIKENGSAGHWEAAAAVFADYWTGPGSWDAMPDDRRSKFAKALQPNFHEWDAVMNEATPLAVWCDALPENTTVISAEDTVRSIREIVELLEAACPNWHFEKLGKGGHMAALTRPEIMNPIIRRALA